VIRRPELADAGEPIARPRSSANSDVVRSIVPAAGLIAACAVASSAQVIARGRRCA
jgi:hypothetical protein